MPLCSRQQMRENLYVYRKIDILKQEENETKLELILLTFCLMAARWSARDLQGLAVQSIFKHCPVLKRLLLLTAQEPSAALKSCFFVLWMGRGT